MMNSTSDSYSVRAFCSHHMAMVTRLGRWRHIYTCKPHGAEGAIHTWRKMHLQYCERWETGCTSKTSQQRPSGVPLSLLPWRLFASMKRDIQKVLAVKDFVNAPKIP